MLHSRSGLFHSLIPAALDRWSGDKAPNSIRAVVWHVCRRVARDWDPNRVSPPPDRGVMGLPDEMELKAKQVASGQWSSAKRLSETLDAMADEINRIEATGHAARKADLIETTKWSRATVNRRFDDAVVLAYYRAQPVSGKKEITLPHETVTNRLTVMPIGNSVLARRGAADLCRQPNRADEPQ